MPGPHSTGIIGYRKYYQEPTKNDAGEIVFNPQTSPYEENEIKENKRYVVGSSCVVCHVGFDPTNPPENPNELEWEHLNAHIGNQHIKQPMRIFMGAGDDHFANQILNSNYLGTADTSLIATDWQHNPTTQNNVTDFVNKRIFQHEMKDPVTGEISTAGTRHVLKGGEDSVGEHLALVRVYLNTGTCTEECWVPNFPHPGQLIGQGSGQSPFRIMQCAKDCDAWNYADSKMDDLAAFLITGGPTYLLASTDVDGTKGNDFIDLDKVPEGREIYTRECASCHSSKVAQENIRADKNAIAKFYEGHVFGSEDYWQFEFSEAQRNSPEFIEKYLVATEDGRLRPRQFASDGIFGQDWLSNDERVHMDIIGTNSCRAQHDNHNEGHIFEEFSSETYKNSASAGTKPKVVNRLLPVVGGMEVGEKEITGGPGYLKNLSLLSVWATAPFIHNNSIGEVTFMEDGTPDYTVKGRIDQFHMAFDELMRSDDPLAENARPQKIAKLQYDMELPTGTTVPAGTAVSDFASASPKSLYMRCDDPIENKGHQFGVNLSDTEKLALREFLKIL